MPEESKFVTHEHLNDRDRAIYKYVDKGHSELKELYHQMDKKLELDKQRGELTIEQQNKMIVQLDKVNENLSGFNRRIEKVEETSIENTSEIKAIKETAEDKKKGTRDIILAVISAVTAIAVAAFGAAQYLF